MKFSETCGPLARKEPSPKINEPPKEGKVDSLREDAVLGEIVEMSDPVSTRSLTRHPFIFEMIKILSLSSEVSGFDMMLDTFASLICFLNDEGDVYGFSFEGDDEGDEFGFENSDEYGFESSNECDE